MKHKHKTILLLLHLILGRIRFDYSRGNAENTL